MLSILVYFVAIRPPARLNLSVFSIWMEVLAIFLAKFNPPYCVIFIPDGQGCVFYHPYGFDFRLRDQGLQRYGMGGTI